MKQPHRVFLGTFDEGFKRPGAVGVNLLYLLSKLSLFRRGFYGYCYEG